MFVFNALKVSHVQVFYNHSFSWKTAEKLFLDAMDKIKAIGNEVGTLFNVNMKSLHEKH